MRSWHLPFLCLFYSSNPICQLPGFLAIEACLLPSETWISPIIPLVRNFPPPPLSNSASCWWVKLWKLAMWLRTSLCEFLVAKFLNVSVCEFQVWDQLLGDWSSLPLSEFPCCVLSYLAAWHYENDWMKTFATLMADFLVPPLHLLKLLFLELFFLLENLVQCETLKLGT